jgi:hypothetical protein
MPESDEETRVAAELGGYGKVVTSLALVERKLDVLAQALGGATLKARWDSIEEEFGRGVRRRTFKRRRCGCFVGSPHGEACSKAAR